jgi:GTP-binding protein EngB required for normal cell division
LLRRSLSPVRFFTHQSIIDSILQDSYDPMADTTTETATKQPSTSNLKIDFCTDEHVQLLDAIDKLRELNIESDIPLPQVIVIGDQNAGKSSVLEAISRIPFPTQDGVQTRFAIEVILRRSQTSRTRACLIPKGQHVAGQEVDIEGFEKNLKALGDLTILDVPKIVQLATDALGVEKAQSFTDHVLHIEDHGPDQQNLSFVDLPGFYQYVEGSENDRGATLVERMAERYMRNEHSIILAVISGKYDYGNQQTLVKVKEIDHSGMRTLGVLTAIDGIQPGESLESRFFALATNRIQKLKLGWHVLRNPNSRERNEPNFDRLALETAAFSVAPWHQIPPKSRGSQALKTRLSRVLLEHVERNIGNVVQAINEKISITEQEVQQLGEHRATTKERQAYLLRVATKHGRLVEAGLKGHYEDAFFETTHQRLRAAVRHRFEAFIEIMATHGHKWELSAESEKDHREYTIPGLCSAKERPILITREHYLQIVDTVLRDQRGIELPDDTNPELIGTLFRDQSLPWKRLAESLISDVMNIVTRFLKASILHVTEPRRALLIYQQKLGPALEIRETLMKDKLRELMRPFARAPMTYSSDYRDRLHRNKKSQNSTQQSNDDSINRAACERLLNQLETYYSITKEVFVDNVINLGIETCILDDLTTIFCPSALIDTWDDVTEQLASDFPEDAERRKMLTRNLQGLKEGREICRIHDRSSFDQRSPVAVVHNTKQESEPVVFDTSHLAPRFTFSAPETPATPDRAQHPLSRTPSPASRMSSGRRSIGTARSPSSASTTPLKPQTYREKADDTDTDTELPARFGALSV